MKNTLLNPTTYRPEIEGEMLDQFLRRIGIPISELSSNFSHVTIRVTPNLTVYGFKLTEDCKAMSNFLIDNDIEFEYDTKSKGARFPYHIILMK